MYNSVNLSVRAAFNKSKQIRDVYTNDAPFRFTASIYYFYFEVLFIAAVP